MRWLKLFGGIKNILKISLILILAQCTLHSEDLWSHITETTAGNGYYKKIINLGLQLNYIHYRPAKKEKSMQVLVMMSPNDTNDHFFKTILEKFHPEIAVLNYKFDNNTTQVIPIANESYKKTRIKQYIKQGNLLHVWPPIYTETVEIKRELSNKNLTEKFLLLTGSQSNFLNHSELINDFNRIIIVSPKENLESTDNTKWQSKQVLWIGALYEKSKLEAFQSKYGGKILTYERSATGINLLMRNQEVLDDILSWLNS